MRVRSVISTALGVLTAAVLLTGCASAGSTGAAGASPSGGSSPVRVVASVSEYGSIVQSIGGRFVDVTSVIAKPDQDPHSYQAGARMELALSKAQLIVENGGGYDSFIDTLRASLGSHAPVINVVRLSGLDHGSPDFNEHVFYDVPTMLRLVSRVEQVLAGTAPEHASTFRANAAALGHSLRGLEAETAALRATFHGTHVAYTEPVPGYLFDAIGLVNVTPPAFSHAVENGNDVPPAALNTMLHLVGSRSTVRLLAFNEQASSVESELVKQRAAAAGVPVVGVTETLPAGMDYVAWQQSNIDHLTEALHR